MRIAEDAVGKAVGDGTEGLFVVMAFRGHQPPVDFGEVRVDLPGGVGGEHERAFDAVVAALGDGLAKPLGAAADGAARGAASTLSTRGCRENPRINAARRPSRGRRWRPRR